MGDNPAQSMNPADVPTPGCHDDSGLILDAGYSVVGPQEASFRLDIGSSLRGSGLPFKRYAVGGRFNGKGAGISNVFHSSSVEGNQSRAQFLLNGKPVGRGNKTEVEGVGARSRSCICSILISIVLCYFLAEAMLQGSVMMLLKHTD
eukprot:c54865_g1_i1 orf=2-439(-)